MPRNSSSITSIGPKRSASAAALARCLSLSCLVTVGCAEEPSALRIATNLQRLIGEPQIVAEGEANTTDRFASRIAISGGSIAIGAPGQVLDGEVLGAVSFYRNLGTQWEEQQVLWGPELPSESSFGRELSLADDLLVVGAPNYDEPTSNHGIAYVYQQSNGQDWRLVNSLGAELEGVSGIGDAVVTDGQSVFVGVRTVEVGGDRQGAVLVYEMDADGNWVEVQRLLSSVDRAGFGSSLVLQGDVAVVGNLVAEAFVYERDAAGVWQELQVLRQDRSGTGFSSSLALFGDVLAVGASSDNETGATRGAVSIFERDSARWEFRQKILPDPETLVLGLGASLAVSGELLVSGAPNSVVGERQPGAAVIYQRGADGVWFEIHNLVPGNLEDARTFGASAALDGQTLVIGDPGFTNQPGAAHIYTASPDTPEPDDADGGGLTISRLDAGAARQASDSEKPAARDGSAAVAPDLAAFEEGSTPTGLSRGGCQLGRVDPRSNFGCWLVLGVVIATARRRGWRLRRGQPVRELEISGAT